MSEADRAIAEWTLRGEHGPVVCASGVSPSGPIHLGNLREVTTPHFVADEIRRRGLPCRHLQSWDDYDRLRKVPLDVPESFAEHIGRPLSGIPDPCGEHESWAEHFKAPFREAMAALDIELDEISQTQMYTSGAYTQQIITAMAAAEQIDEILGRHRTAATAAGEAPDGSEDAVTGSRYYPYKPYCSTCGRDTTTVLDYNPATTTLTYRCHCGHEGTVNLTTDHHGKLVWKVDWPMRWAYENVQFETAGVDHSSPGSSFTVGSQIVRDVFDGRPPVYTGYSFVGVEGQAKMSGSRGGVPTPSDALSVMEPAIVRWLYVRRKPRQSFTISFGSEIGRVYDEWDALSLRVAEGRSAELETAVHLRSQTTAASTLPSTPRPMPFRTLASVLDVTAFDQQQALRVLATVDPDLPVDQPDLLEPRLGLAATWAQVYLPAEERTHVRETPAVDQLAELSDDEKEAVALLLAEMDSAWTLTELTTLLYGIPKRQLGLPPDTEPTPELKARQRSFFALLYELLVARDTGPRLPTLLLSVGADRVRSLLTHP